MLQKDAEHKAYVDEAVIRMDRERTQLLKERAAAWGQFFSKISGPFATVLAAFSACLLAYSFLLFLRTRVDYADLMRAQVALQKSAIEKQAAEASNATQQATLYRAWLDADLERAKLAGVDAAKAFTEAIERTPADASDPVMPDADTLSLCRAKIRVWKLLHDDFVRLESAIAGSETLNAAEKSLQLVKLGNAYSEMRLETGKVQSLATLLRWEQEMAARAENRKTQAR